MWEALFAITGSLLFSCASEPATGELGELDCGYMTSAAWTRPGEHPWPPPR